MSSAPPTPSKRHGTWHAFDAPSERQKLFSPWTIAGFGLAVGLGLALVYPHKALEQRLAAADSAAGSSALAIEYLKVFLKADPEAGEMRLQLAKKLAQIGDVAGAQQLLEAPQAQNDPAIRGEALWIRLALAEQQYYAASPGSPARQAAQRDIHQRLAALLAQRLSAQQLYTVGTHALANEEAELARAAFARLAQAPAALATPSLEQAARGALGVGDYRSSAQLSLAAMARSADIDARRRYFLAAMRTLQSGGLQQEALEQAAQRLGPLADDTETLKFLARLARAANRPDIAERYAKRFLELALLERMQEWRETRLVAWHGQPQPAPESGGARMLRIAAAGAGAGPGLAFDEESYALGYDIFLSNRNLADALRVAQSAVRQRPQSAAWRRRLAEVSEWSGAPREALEQWLVHAQLSGDEASWDAVLRLSDSLFDLTRLRAALEHKLAREPMQLSWLERLLALDEQAGEPQAAIARLQKRLAAVPALPATERERELGLLEAVEERAGRDADALAMATELQRQFGPRTGYALKIANLHYRRGALPAAFDALEAARAQAAANDALYWRNYAELARLLGNDAAAERGYRALIAAGAQTPADLSNLVALWSQERPRAAAALAADAYLRGGEPALAEQALSLWSRVAERREARAFLQLLSPQQRDALAARASFLILRAALAQSSENLAGARADLRAALALEPGNVEARAALIWVLIATRDTEPLKQALQLWSADAAKTPALWDGYAAALMSINRQDEALRWFGKIDLKSRRGDALWLMSYAECLEANSQADLAWRLRRQVWDLLRDADAQRRLRPAQVEAMRERLAALAPLFAGGDASWRLLQSLLRADPAQLAGAPQHAAPAQDARELLARLDAQPQQRSDGGDDARLSAGARELALSYALNQDANDLARAWLAARYAGQLAKPLYAELSLALQADDRDSLNRLLDQLPDWLPIYDRIDAARRAQRPALAQTLAFEQLSRLPDDEQLHQRLVELATENGPRLSAGVVHRSESPLVYTESTVTAAAMATPGLRFSLQLSERSQRSDDGAQLLNPPQRDRRVALTATRALDSGSVAATLQRREALAGSTGIKLQADIAPLRGLQLSGTIGLNQAAQESVPLAIGGMRHLLSGSASYALSSRAFIRMDLGWQRFYSQAGAALGSGRSWRIEAGERLRLAAPDLTLSAYVSGNRFQPNGGFDAQIASLLPAGADPAATLLPQGSRTVGLRLSTGDGLENGYRRAWLPFGAVGVFSNTVTGRGYDLRAGAAGSVLGADMLRLYLDKNAGTPAAPQGSREVGLKYDAFY
jgi:hypothetical protein